MRYERKIRDTNNVVGDFPSPLIVSRCPSGHRYISYLLSLICFLYLLYPTCLYGIDIYLELKSRGRRSNIFIESIDDSKTAQDIVKIVKADLSYSGIFNVITLPANRRFTGKFNFPKIDRDMAVVNGIDTVVKFKTKTKTDKISLTAYCWDAVSVKKIFDKKYKATPRKIRKLAHNFSQDIVKFLTGQEIKFSSKIVFSNTSSGSKEIWCVDYDGKNLTRLTRHNSISVLPKFSNDDRYVFYTTYKENNPDVFRYDFKKAKSIPFLTYQGINITGSVSPDGKYLVATLSKDGDPELYLFTTGGKLIKRLTYSMGIDTSASFSPNSQEFIFVSNRGGNPQLFVMDIDGTNLRKITHSGYNDSPVWSPVGDKIAFTRRNGSVFDIYLLDVTTKKEYQLTKNSASNENPSFSSDGRHIVFSSNRKGRYRLFTMLADGTNQKPLGAIPGDSTNPVWSP